MQSGLLNKHARDVGQRLELNQLQMLQKTTQVFALSGDYCVLTKFLSQLDV